MCVCVCVSSYPSWTAPRSSPSRPQEIPTVGSNCRPHFAHHVAGPATMSGTGARLNIFPTRMYARSPHAHARSTHARSHTGTRNGVAHAHRGWPMSVCAGCVCAHVYVDVCVSVLTCVRGRVAAHGARALTGVKQRLKGAKMGYSLLKKKSDALTLKFRAVAKKIMEVRPPPMPTRERERVCVYARAHACVSVCVRERESCTCVSVWGHACCVSVGRTSYCLRARIYLSIFLDGGRFAVRAMLRWRPRTDQELDGQCAARGALFICRGRLCRRRRWVSGRDRSSPPPPLAASHRANATLAAPTPIHAFPPLSFSLSLSVSVCADAAWCVAQVQCA
jgi:hypothetical protein